MRGARAVPPAGAVFHALPWYEGVFTGMFMHASWEHILGNMLFLWIFGNNVEDAIGSIGFLFWYLGAGIVAMAAQTAVTLAFAGTSGASIPNIGASGAIAGVLGAYFVLLPARQVLTLIFIIIREIPAFWFLLIWFGLQAGRAGSRSSSRRPAAESPSSPTSAGSPSARRRSSSWRGTGRRRPS